VKRKEKKERKIRRVLDQDSVVRELKIKGIVATDHIVRHLPLEMWYEISKFLTDRELMTFSTVDKTFYSLAGNERRWKLLVQELVLPCPNAEINQTFKSIVASFNVGPKKCAKCGARTTRRVAAWNMSICRSCQQAIALTKTQAKKLYLVNDEDLSSIHSIGTPTAALFLKSDIEQLSIKKYNGIVGLENEIQRRKMKKENQPLKTHKEPRKRRRNEEEPVVETQTS